MNRMGVSLGEVGWQKPAMWSELHELASTPLLVMVFISTGVRAQVGNRGFPVSSRPFHCPLCCGLDKSALRALPEVLGPQIPRLPVCKLPLPSLTKQPPVVPGGVEQALPLFLGATPSMQPLCNAVSAFPPPPFRTHVKPITVFSRERLTKSELFHSLWEGRFP